jgi:EmrB/QacA subfamily drug resistance transporter
MAVGTLITVADIGEVSIAMPAIADEFNTDLSTVQWLMTGYLVAISAFLLPMGRLSDMVGRKKVYLWGLLIFGLGSALAALAPNFGSLILFRVLQGFGLGMVQGNQMAIMTSIFPAEERGKALGIHMTLVGTALIIGPVLGGVLVDAFGWRSVFYINVPLGALCVLPGFLVLDEGRIMQGASKDRRGGFDWLGAILSSAALLTFLVGMTNPLDWAVGYSVTVLAASAGLVVVFVLWELRTPYPMFDLSLFKIPIFSLGVTARAFAFITSSSTIFIMPFYLQGVRGYSPAGAGLIIATVAVGMVTIGPVAGRLSDRFGWRFFNVGGAAISVAGLLVLSQITENSSLYLIILGIGLQSSGMGMFSAPNSSSILSGVPRGNYGVISGFVQLLRTGSTVTGVALAAVVISVTMSSMGFEPNLKEISDGADPEVGRAFVSGLRTVYLAMAGLQVLAVIISMIKPKTAVPLAPQEQSAHQTGDGDSD